MNDLLASNDPMGTPIAAIGPPPPMNTTPQGAGQQNSAMLHERTLEQQLPSTPIQSPKKSRASSGLSRLHREAFTIACCAFIVLIPNLQQIMLGNLPMLAGNATLLTVVNAVLIAAAYLLLKDHLLELI